MIMTEPLTWVRAIHFAATAIVAGTIFFLYVIADPVLRDEQGQIARAADRLRMRLKSMARINLAIVFASGSIWLILQTASISGLTFAELLSDNVTWTVLAETRFGHVCALRGLLAILLALSLIPIGSAHQETSGGVKLGAVALAALLLAALAWAGHAGAGSGSGAGFHLATDTLHLVAAGVWIGGLAPLAVCLASAYRADDPAWERVGQGVIIRFSSLGVISVAALLATGVANTWFLAGSVPSLIGTDYGRLLIVKVALFAAMICIAAINRFRLTPRLPYAPAVRQLRINCRVELVLGLLVIVMASVLGMLPPPLHIHH